MAQHLGLLLADASIVAKDNTKHNLPHHLVQEALQFPARARTGWEDHELNGRRLVAMGSTSQGRELIAWLLPLPAWDEDSDTWLVKSARWL